MYRLITVMVFCVFSVAVRADLPSVISWSHSANLDTVYDSIYKSLEDNRFYVVFEPDIGASLEKNKARWGDDYNRNGLQGIRSMVFCNPWYANQVSNLDPEMLATCPLHITLYRQGDVTRIVFTSPVFTGAGSPAADILEALEKDVSGAIRAGLEFAGSVEPSMTTTE